MDIVYINDLKVDTVIGIFDWERRIRQTVSLDLEMAADICKGAASDHIDDALDYKAIGKRLITFIEGSEFQLVETLAENVAQLVLNEFSVPWLKLRLSKPGALRGARDVGVIIERGVRPDA
ncbi:dihydroneopterin aldolase [Alcanivorax sp.]|uniref:dihydroneopterin aldolase n=1 Tax=Alcanivorax sp. TaxID=1872427 RepID=UPI0032D91075